MPWEYCGIASCSTLLSYNTVHYCGNPGKMSVSMCHKTHNNCFKLSVSDNHCNTFTCQFFTMSLFYTTWTASTRLDNFAASLFHFLFMWSKKTSVWLLRNTSLSLLKVQEAHNNLARFQGCNFGAFYLASELKNISFLPGVKPPLTAAFTLTIQYSTLETFQWPLVAIKYLIYYNNLFEKIWDQLENFALRLFRGSHGFNRGGSSPPPGPPCISQTAVTQLHSSIEVSTRQRRPCDSNMVGITMLMRAVKVSWTGFSRWAGEGGPGGEGRRHQWSAARQHRVLGRHRDISYS